jgi:hypothetical protein
VVTAAVYVIASWVGPELQSPPPAGQLRHLRMGERVYAEFVPLPDPGPGPGWRLTWDPTTKKVAGTRCLPAVKASL